MYKICLLLLPLCVTCFRFPKDWLKIRQSMLERERRQREQAANANSLGVRGAFDDDGPSNMMFDDLDEPFRITTYRSTTTTTTTPAPPILLEPWMARMMETVNVTELEARFARGPQLGVRMFGEPEPPPVFSCCMELHNVNDQEQAVLLIQWELFVLASLNPHSNQHPPARNYRAHQARGHQGSRLSPVYLPTAC